LQVGIAVAGWMVQQPTDIFRQTLWQHAGKSILECDFSG